MSMIDVLFQFLVIGNSINYFDFSLSLLEFLVFIDDFSSMN